MSEEIRYRRGFVREDGMKFWQFQKGKPYWVSPEDFNRMRIEGYARSKKFRENNTEEVSKYQKDYAKKHSERRKAYSREYAAATRLEKAEARNEATRRWRERNPEKVKANSREQYSKNADKRRAYAKQYALDNPEKVREAARCWQNKKRKEDPVHVLRCSFRTRLGNALRQNGFKKTQTSVAMLGCTWEEFKLHIESQFLPGMTWENRGKGGWHVDHTLPLASATTIEELQKLCHYTNLRPLPEKDNWEKGSKLPCGKRIRNSKK